VSKEADIERLARVLCVEAGLDPNTVVLKQRTPWVTTFGAFDIITDLHRPETAWKWFAGPAYAILEDGWIQPAPTVEPEPEGVVNPDLPGFEFGHPAAPETAPATLEESWRTRMGLA
jgi:hypothetical protein